MCVAGGERRSTLASSVVAGDPISLALGHACGIGETIRFNPVFHMNSPEVHLVLVVSFIRGTLS